MSLLLRDVGAPRRASLQALLSHAWATGAFTASEAMAAVGTSRSTTIEALDELASLGLLQELPNARAIGDYRKGRPSRRFELRAEAGVVVGVDAGVAHVVTSLADLRGRASVTHTRRLARGADSAATRRDIIAETVEGALAESGRTREDVLAVSVGVPAPVDSNGRSPAHRDQFWSRMNPELGELFATWAPIVRVENDAALAAIAEHTQGAAMGLRDTVTLLAGERLGAGVVVDGTLLRGAHGGVGELVVVRHLEGVQAGHGFGHQIADWARELSSDGTLPADHPLRTHDLTGRTVFELARTGDRHAQALVERIGRVLARISGVLASLYNPQRIIVAGGVAPGIEDALEVARRLLPDELDLPAPELIASPLGGEVVSIGAVAAALKAARDHVLRVR